MASVTKDINFKTRVTGTGAAKSKIQGVEKTAVTSANKMSASFKKMGMMFGAAFGGQQILSFFVSAKNAARDAEEIRSMFEQVFISIKDNAFEMAKDFSASFKLANTTTLELLANTGDLLVGFGFTEKAALDMSVSINRLAQDLASFRNIDTKTASIALTKALLGETESAKALGIVIRQSTKEFTDNVAAIMKAKGVTLLQAKAIEILRIVYRQSAKAVGDFERTQDSLANKEKILSEAFKQIEEDIGTGLIPAFTGLTSAVQTLNDLLGDESGGFISTLVRLSVIAVTLPLEILNWRIAFEEVQEAIRKVNEEAKGLTLARDMMVIIREKMKGFGIEVKGVVPWLQKQKDKLTLINDELKTGNVSQERNKFLRDEIKRINELVLGTEKKITKELDKQLAIIHEATQLGGQAPDAGQAFPGIDIRLKPEDIAKVTEVSTVEGLEEGFTKAELMMANVAQSWTRVLSSNFSQFWDDTFGYANSLLEQLLKATFMNIFTGLFSFLPGGGLGGLVLSWFEGSTRGGGATSNVIVLKLGDDDVGTFVQKGNEYIKMRGF